MNDSDINFVKREASLDIPILIIFFVRPQLLIEVFKQVCLARPQKLFLYQDGPRQNHPEDIEKIHECRQIFEKINWECEVKTKYQEENVGCDPSEYIAIKWAFGFTEKCIVLEDDDVPSPSFFPYCQELLERYKDDERINMICGLNHMGEYKKTPYSYVFTKSGAITGWASWKRVIDQWDESYSFLSDQESIILLEGALGKKKGSKFIEICNVHKESGKAHYESIFGSSLYLNNRLNIVPCKNLISNIGIGSNATHGGSSLDQLPKGIRKIFFMKTYILEFPLKHPKYVIEDVRYMKGIDRILGNGYPFVQFYRKIENIYYRSIHGDFTFVSKILRKVFFSTK